VKERNGHALFDNSAFLAMKLSAAGVSFVNVIWTSTSPVNSMKPRQY